MGFNKNYARFDSGTKEFAPDVLDWSKVHTEEYPETEFDEETGEEHETGKMLTYDWTERHRYYHPTRQQYADMGWFRILEARPEESAGDGKHWEIVGTGTSEDDYGIVEPEGGLRSYHRKYTAVDDPEPDPVIRKWTRLSIIRTLISEGLFDQVSAALTELQRKQFYACDYILENDEVAKEVIAAAKEKFGEDVVTALIDKIPVEP